MRSVVSIIGSRPAASEQYHHVRRWHVRRRQPVGSCTRVCRGAGTVVPGPVGGGLADP
jgi:hypothetical protein